MGWAKNFSVSIHTHDHMYVYTFIFTLNLSFEEMSKVFVLRASFTWTFSTLALINLAEVKIYCWSDLFEMHLWCNIFCNLTSLFF